MTSRTLIKVEFPGGYIQLFACYVLISMNMKDVRRFARMIVHDYAVFNENVNKLKDELIWLEHERMISPARVERICKAMHKEGIDL